jgi:hypothetical protein
MRDETMSAWGIEMGFYLSLNISNETVSNKSFDVTPEQFGELIVTLEEKIAGLVYDNLADYLPRLFQATAGEDFDFNVAVEFIPREDAPPEDEPPTPQVFH